MSKRIIEINNSGERGEQFIAYSFYEGKKYGQMLGMSQRIGEEINLKKDEARKLALAIMKWLDRDNEKEK